MGYAREHVLQALRDAASSDAVELHFKVPNRPLVRVTGGALVPMSGPPLTPSDTSEIAQTLMRLAGVEIPLAGAQDIDIGLGLSGIGRFRIAIYRQRGSVAVVVRSVATSIPTLASLGATALDPLVGRPGLLLACGPMRTNFLAACASAYNARERGHVSIIEGQLGFLHRDGMAAIAQREVGVDVATHAAGIRGAMRVGSDLILIDEIPDAAAADALLEAAERGFSTVAGVAAPTADEAAWWLLRTIPGESRPDAERRLTSVLTGVVAIGPDGSPHHVPGTGLLPATA